VNPSDPGLPAGELTIETPAAAQPAAEAPPVATEPAIENINPEPTTDIKMESVEATPEDEKKMETSEVTTPPENPAAALREQIIALVPDEAKSQVAALIRSLLDFAPKAAPSEAVAPTAEPESAVTRKRYEHLPFRPRITREETASSSEPYGSLAGDPEPE